MTTFISDYLCSKNHQIKVVHNVNVSPHALKILNKKNVELIRSKVGHSNIKSIMRKKMQTLEESIVHIFTTRKTFLLIQQFLHF